MAFEIEQYKEMSEKIARVKEEISKFIVGQEQAVNFTLYAILADGHLLLEGLPGLGKTMLVRTIADVLNLQFSRIQFTPDLMPADITGTSMIERAEQGKQQFTFQKGPIFSQIVLADEINRATPKTQSALLEAMGEKTVTVLGDTKPMEKPFFVLATQNPIEMEGTYPLPEAQLDRFIGKILLTYPTRDELMQIIDRTTGAAGVSLSKVMDAETIILAQKMVKEVIIAEDLVRYAIDLCTATSPVSDHTVDEVKQYVLYGCGPRGVQSVVKLAKARALINGRYHVSVADIKEVLKPALRHRILLNYEGEAAEQTPDTILDVIVQKIQQGAAV